jgi:nicotinamidase-related amidase
MPISTLDPETALIVIDLQKGIVSLPVAHPIDEVIERASQPAPASSPRLVTPTSWDSTWLSPSMP